MSDITTDVVPVPDSALEDHYGRTVSMQAAQAMQWRKAARRARWGEASLLILSLALGATVLSLLPLVRYVPVFVFTNQDGVNDTATAISDLPPSTRVAGIEALLWRYLREREHYAPSEADESYNVVSALSADPVREQYQKWANPKLNREAPAVKLGQRGFIRIYRRNSSWLAHSEDYSEGVFQIGFCRVIAPEGQTPLAQKMTATLRYQLVDRVPLWERVTFNPVGLMVTEYPGPEAEDTQMRPVRLGGDNPCGN